MFPERYFRGRTSLVDIFHIVPAVPATVGGAERINIGAELAFAARRLDLPSAVLGAPKVRMNTSQRPTPFIPCLRFGESSTEEEDLPE